MFKRFKIRAHEKGLLFRDGGFVRMLDSGTHWMFDPKGRYACDKVNMRESKFEHGYLREIIDSEALSDQATVIDLKDHQRALVWIDGRFKQILPSGLHAFWTTRHDVRIETIDTREFQFTHEEFGRISRCREASVFLDICEISRNCVGVTFVDGRFHEVLDPGRYAFWRGAIDVRVVEVDLRERVMDVSGQDLMTADKVSLRLNALVTYKVVDARKSVCVAEDASQALYREVQLVLRHVIGGRTLDQFLGDKDAVALEASGELKSRAEAIGLELVSLGIRDVILPGDMKDLMNKVTEAKKAAEANLIFRREETAAMRSQANTAKLLESNPVLMRLRELEVLEKIANSTNLQVVLGEGGLAERLTKLI